MRSRAWWVPVPPAALAMLAGAGRPWVRASADDPVLGGSVLEVTGAEVGPVVVAAAVLAGAATVAGLAGGSVVRLVAAGCLALAGALALAQSVRVLVDPASALGATIAERTARTGAPVELSAASITPWPWLVALASALLLLAGLACARSARARAPETRTGGPGRDGSAAGRGGSSRPAGEGATTAWDALSRGEDPTDPR